MLDKCVPGYYHRRNSEGGIESSTCMNNTASEHLMCERLIVDDLLHWARDFKARSPRSTAGTQRALQEPLPLRPKAATQAATRRGAARAQEPPSAVAAAQ